LTAGSQHEWAQAREARSHIIETARTHAGFEDEAGLDIIKLVGKDILSCTNTDSVVFPLAIAMREIFSKIYPYDGKHDDPASYFERVVSEDNSWLFWSCIMDWENNNTREPVNGLFGNSLDFVRVHLQSCDFKADLPAAADFPVPSNADDDRAHEHNPILRLDNLWEGFKTWVRSQGSAYYLSIGDLGLVSEISRQAINIRYTLQAGYPEKLYTPSADRSGLCRTRGGVREEFKLQTNNPFPAGPPICEIANTGGNHYERFGPLEPERTSARDPSSGRKSGGGDRGGRGGRGGRDGRRGGGEDSVRVDGWGCG